VNYLATSNLPVIEEEEATGDVARVFAEVKREMQIPYVPNWGKALAVSPAALATHWDFQRSFYQRMTLPRTLTAMILYTVAETGNCKYCSALNEMYCRTMGIDGEMLSALVKELDNVSPERIRAIIAFALKAARHAQEMEREDFDRLREQGVTDEEIMEILLVAAMSRYTNTLSDVLQIDVDSAVTETLESLR
jgi:uncharacterized peroxidase-related enzyme